MKPLKRGNVVFTKVIIPLAENSVMEGDFCVAMVYKKNNLKVWRPV